MSAICIVILITLTASVIGGTVVPWICAYVFTIRRDLPNGTTLTVPMCVLGLWITATVEVER